MGKWIDDRKRAYEQWRVIQEVDTLLARWRFENDDSYRQEAIRVLTEAR